jgi:hypothetical protein
MYYPKSQIKTNLYTNGGEYILSTTNQPYKGYYYEISTGKKYSGKFPKDTLDILLLSTSDKETTSPPGNAFINDNGEIEYSDVLPLNEIILNIEPPIPTNKSLFINRSLPIFNPTLPTEQDKQNGQFVRYFCKKTNENKYLEIDKDTYQKLQLQDPKIAWDLYNPSQIIWQIKGDKTQVYSTNKGSTAIIEQQRKWYGFTQWFQDKFLKYYLES